MHEPAPAEPLLIVVMLLAFATAGVVILYGARRRWRWLVDPPEWLYLFYSQSMLKVLFGRRFLVGFTYLIGVSFLVAGLFGLAQILISPTIRGNLHQRCESCPEAQESISTAQNHLQTLLENIVVYGNAAMVSILVLVGIRMKWFLHGNPPLWMKSLLEDNRAVRVLNVVFTLIALISLVRLFPYLKELGHGLGYF